MASEVSGAPAASVTLVRAAEYVRMSTEHQKYSIANQSEAIRVYAAIHNMEVVRTYADEGRSGLSIEGRDALKQLIEDVETRNADFTAILVYDVSRWGRFQDTDESGYYEYLCKRAGIAVTYCAEPFENDGTPLSAIIKAIKRAMAGEYSRELSVKTFAAQRRVVQLGYRLGASPGYGLRRALVDDNGKRKAELAPGEWKSIIANRVILVPGPPNEVETVRWIYSAFVETQKTEFQIATILNKKGSRNDHGRPWNRHAIKRILKGEKYVGDNVWAKTSFKLQRTFVRNARELWLRADNAFEAIIDRDTFDAAQAVYGDRAIHPIRGRPRRYSDEEMLQRLRQLLERNGFLSKGLLDQSADIQAASAYEARFGSLTQAYALIGFTQRNRKRKRIRHHKGPRLSDEEMLEKLQALLRDRGDLSERIIARTKTVPSRTAYVSRFGSINRAYELIGFKPDPYKSLSARPHGLSDEELLEALRRAVEKHGRLSQSIIADDKSLPAYHYFQHRFGGLRQAYKLIGYKQKRLPPIT